MNHLFVPLFQRPRKGFALFSNLLQFLVVGKRFEQLIQLTLNFVEPVGFLMHVGQVGFHLGHGLVKLDVLRLGNVIQRVGSHLEACFEDLLSLNQPGLIGSGDHLVSLVARFDVGRGDPWHPCVTHVPYKSVHA